MNGAHVNGDYSRVLPPVNPKAAALAAPVLFAACPLPSILDGRTTVHPTVELYSSV